jgi:DnaA family protein
LRTNPQLALGIGIRESASFSNFIPGGNGQTLEQVRRAATGEGEQFIYLWGSEHTGKTHLLQAACQEADQHMRTAVYIPLELFDEVSPEMLADLDSLDLVCLDNVDSIAGNSAWEEALFHLFNQLRAKGVSLMVTAAGSPAAIDWKLPDLASRMSWGISYQIQPLNDDEKAQALVAEADSRGISMSEDTARYILRRTSRNLSDLQQLLDQLDRASLQAQRRITTPFVKAYLEGSPGEED